MKKAINFSDLLSLGENFFYSGQKEKYLQVMRLGSKVLADLMRSGNVDKALTLEPSFYNKLVKKIESEENYYEGFYGHAGAFHEAGQNDSDNSLLRGDPNKIVFIAHSSVLLGHTEVMLNLLASWKRQSSNVVPYFIGLTPMQNDLGERLHNLGVKFYAPVEKMSPSQLISWCQLVIKEESISTAIWLSTPCWVSYIFARRIAKKQIMWSLKFHPLNLGNDVLHIGFGRKSERFLAVNNKEWISYSPPLSLNYKKPTEFEINAIKSKYFGKYVYGTLARTEKYNSPIFVKTLVQILSACPDSIYIYTGRQKSHLLESEFRKNGISSQLSYVGWVDTNIYSAVLDCFLESFPFGCGITSLQSLRNDVPVVSMWDTNTVARVYFDNQKLANTYSNNFHCFSELDDYINKAIELYKVRDHQKTDRVFDELELNMAKRFLKIVGVHSNE